MASYASVVSKPVPVVTIQDEIAEWIEIMAPVTAPENLVRLVELLRKEMEIPTSFRGNRAGDEQKGWRSGIPNQGQASQGQMSQAGQGRFGSSKSNAFDTRPRVTEKTPPARSGVRYQSRFKAVGDIEEKILNTVIGNKLNAFTSLTYNDTRDFIYQIIDGGETEFSRDFVEKVFMKATLEELYCPLFAKLIAEIAHRYPVMYEEMNKYHTEFLKIFDNVQEDKGVEYETLVKQKQYRMGYGQFIAELAGLNALEKTQLITMVTKVFEKISLLSAEEERTKAVEEFIDCLVRLTTGLKDRSFKFFQGVKGDVLAIIGEKLNALISKTSPTPSLSNKGRFGLMDLKDILEAK